MAKKPTEIEGIDPLTNGKRAHGEDVAGNSVFNKKEVVKSAPKTAKKVAVKAPVDEPKTDEELPQTETPVEDPATVLDDQPVDEFGDPIPTPETDAPKA